MSATAVTWTTGWEPRAPRGGVRAGSAHQSVRSAGTAPASLRLTRRGRVVISLVALAAALGAALSTQSAAADAPVDALPVTTHTVTAGETLWEIAGTITEPGQDRRDVVDRLVELNGLPSAALQVGQQILVPAP